MAGAGGGDAPNTSGSSGASSTAGNNVGSGGVPNPPVHVVVPCDAVEVGKWEEITPPAILASERWKKKDGYGLNALVIDPANMANVMVGTDKLGVHRTTDCGATWKQMNMGRSGADLDLGTNWTFAADSHAADTFYTVSGYHTNGVFKTTNGGRDWDQVLAPDYAKNFVYGGFTAQVRADPTVAGHVIITPHFTCENGHSEQCFLETTNGGISWNVVENAPSGGEGARLLVVDHDHWFSGTNGEGLFRTDNAGKSWTKVTAPNTIAYEVHHRPGGKYYLPTAFGLAQSDDGITWKQLDKAPGTHVVTTSQTRIYASTGGFCVFGESPPSNLITSAPIDDPTNWTVDTGYTNTLGSMDLQYDLDHHILYTTSCLGGMWRVRTE